MISLAKTYVKFSSLSHADVALSWCHATNVSGPSQHDECFAASSSGCSGVCVQKESFQGTKLPVKSPKLAACLCMLVTAEQVRQAGRSWSASSPTIAPVPASAAICASAMSSSNGQKDDCDHWYSSCGVTAETGSPQWVYQLAH